MLKDNSFITGHFYFNGKPISGAPEWGMSLKKAGSMRFRWNEENHVRDAFLCSVAGSEHEIVPVELIHSKIVYTVNKKSDTFKRTGDGIITANKSLIPVVTAADCMPIFIYDIRKGVFGALHSGWKGTGIVEEALLQAHKDFGSDVHDFCIVMAPHIHECCYSVDKDRADYFKSRFSPFCVKPLEDPSRSTKFSLSLAEANLSILKKLGIPEENIYVCNECTCCNEKFGSFRRESSNGSGCFTTQAAWIKW
ncbi:MAG: polyphenol oxidase family protein [Treponema sp.]|nr:polyphenol oxidase family protein [Treponema sp.]